MNRAPRPSRIAPGSGPGRALALCLALGLVAAGAGAGAALLLPRAAVAATVSSAVPTRSPRPPARPAAPATALAPAPTPALATALAAALAPDGSPSAASRGAPGAGAGGARVASAVPAVAAVVVSLRPPPRPLAVGAPGPHDDPLARELVRLVRVTPPVPATVVVAPPPEAGVLASPRPEARPRGLGRTRVAAAAALVPRAPRPTVTGPVGPICGDRAIRGQRAAPIVGRVRGCGVAEPVRVTEVSGVRLSQPAIMDCTTARSLKTWLDRSVKPAIGKLGGGLESMRVLSHYSCRTRNSQPGARISEHGRGKAIDIGAFTLRNGVSISVKPGWNDPVQGKILRRMHAGACGPFGTVLGPRSDRFHLDHFHLDTARHRGGPYCR